MQPDQLFVRYQEMTSYLDWSDADAGRVRLVWNIIKEKVDELVSDFYDEIQKHEATNDVIRGGASQIERLKKSLRQWIFDLFAGEYNADYVWKRWKVGLRHVEIGLDQFYTNVALARMRARIIIHIANRQKDLEGDLLETIVSVNKLLDLDLAIIEDAYQSEYMKRLQAQERMATIGQVAGGVAHELRNPLNVVKTSVYYLLNAKSASPEKIQTHLHRIEKQVTAADKVITALTNFARMPLPDLRHCQVRQCIEETLDVHPMPDEIRITTSFAPDATEFLADSSQLAIVLGNIIRNAREAMPNGGTIHIHSEREGDSVLLRIADSGVGISEELLARVMEPLFSTKARGLGMGLAISKAIMEKNNGALSVTSSVGEGTTFLVRLPACPAKETST